MPIMVYARQTDNFVVKIVKNRHFHDINDVITQNDVIFSVFNITPLDSYGLDVFYKSKMVNVRQIDDFVVKNVKKTIFSTFMTS